MREKTNSVTELVKIIAEEVFEKKFNGMKEMVEKETRESLLKVQECVENAGAIWSNEENKLLDLEMEMAIKQMALNHKRSIGSIKSKVRKTYFQSW